MNNTAQVGTKKLLFTYNNDFELHGQGLVHELGSSNTYLADEQLSAKLLTHAGARESAGYYQLADFFADKTGVIDVADHWWESYFEHFEETADDYTGLHYWVSVDSREYTINAIEPLSGTTLILPGAITTLPEWPVPSTPIKWEIGQAGSLIFPTEFWHFCLGWFNPEALLHE